MGQIIYAGRYSHLPSKYLIRSRICPKWRQGLYFRTDITNAVSHYTIVLIQPLHVCTVTRSFILEYFTSA